MKKIYQKPELEAIVVMTHEGMLAGSNARLSDDPASDALDLGNADELLPTDDSGNLSRSLFDGWVDF